MAAFASDRDGRNGGRRSPPAMRRTEMVEPIEKLAMLSRMVAEGAPFIAGHIIQVTEKAFDDFAGAGTDLAANRKILGLS